MATGLSRPLARRSPHPRRQPGRRSHPIPASPDTGREKPGRVPYRRACRSIRHVPRGCGTPQETSCPTVLHDRSRRSFRLPFCLSAVSRSLPSPSTSTPSAFAAGRLGGRHRIARRHRQRADPYYWLVHRLISDVTAFDGDPARRALALTDRLRFGGGVQLSSTGGPGSTGMVPSAAPMPVTTLIDGFRVSSASLGQTTFEGLPLAHVQRLELLRGPASCTGPMRSAA